MAKRVKVTDLKYTDKSLDVLFMAEELNDKDRHLDAIWLISMNCTSPTSPRKEALRQIIYSIGKLMDTNNAEDVFKGIAEKLGTAPSLIERQLRGMDKVEVITQFGENYINFKE